MGDGRLPRFEETGIQTRFESLACFPSIWTSLMYFMQPCFVFPYSLPSAVRFPFWF